jgi:hypothetical protein
MTIKLDKDQAERKEQQRKEHQDLDDALEDSFPASDPPAITQPTPAPEQDQKIHKPKRRST